jgi:ankyrin repeat protein
LRKFHRTNLQQYDCRISSRFGEPAEQNGSLRVAFVATLLLFSQVTTMASTTTAELPPLPSMDRLVELMMDAARSGRKDIIPALLSAGVELECRDTKGYTPLILASYNGHECTTELLLERGANANNADDDRGNTALMGVAFKGYGGIARLLINAGADINLRNHAGQTALMTAALFGRTDMVAMLLASGADASLHDLVGNTASSLAAAQGNIPLADSLRSSTSIIAQRISS